MDGKLKGMMEWTRQTWPRKGGVGVCGEDGRKVKLARTWHPAGGKHRCVAVAVAAVATNVRCR